MKYDTNITLQELIDLGAYIDVNFHHNKDLQSSYDRLKPFTKFGSIRRGEYDGTVWTAIDDEKNKIQFRSFL